MTAVSNGSGALLGINSYDEYGIPGGAGLGRFRYTGQTWLPEVGLYYYKARMYSPTLGRFMQTDPIGYADGMNMYNYVGGDPVNFMDPTGLCTATAVGKWVSVTVINEDGSSVSAEPTFHQTGVELSGCGGGGGFGPAGGGEGGGSGLLPPPENPPCSSGLQPVAWTPDGNTKGENPRSQGGRYNTDLPGGYEAATAVFMGLSRLDGLANGADGGFRINKNPLRPTTAFISDAGNVALRWSIKNGNYVWRIDINPNTFDLKKAETIHFNGSGQGDMCPTL